MVFSYLKMALRTIQKNFSSTMIQAFGLGIGLTVFILAQVIVNYENNYDTFFENSDNIYAVYVNPTPQSGMGIKTFDGVHSAVQPLFAENLPEVKKSSRLLNRNLLVRVDDNVFNEDMKFVDPDFLSMFDLDFLGSSSVGVLDGPTSVIMSDVIARKYFGDDDPIGKTILVDNEYVLQVTALFKHLPQNTHLMTSVISDAKFGMVATMGALRTISGRDPDENWDNLSSGNYTYVMMPAGMVPADFESQLAAIYETNFNAEMQEMISGFGMRALPDMNLFIWEATGIPAMAALRILGFLILLVAALNYTSLAVALGLNRKQEVGIRKSLGASPRQIFAQFLIETLIITFVALVVAITLIQIVGPKMAEVTGRNITLSLLDSPLTMLSLIALIIGTGLLAGGYPAYAISQSSSVTTIQSNYGGGTKSTRTRSILMGTQFAVSILLVIGVMVTYSQNKKMQEAAFTDIKDVVVTVGRLSRPGISDQVDVLVDQWKRIPGVEQVTTSSQVPFDQSNSYMRVTPIDGDESQKIDLLNIRTGDDFAETYNLNLIAGRNLNSERSGDRYTRVGVADVDRAMVNVVVNEMAATALGFLSPQDAIDQVIYDIGEDADNMSFRIVGVHEDVNFKGFFSKMTESVYTMPPTLGGTASIRVSPINIQSTVEKIDAVWKSVLPQYPIQRRYLDDGFQDIMTVFQGFNSALVIFAFVAITMATVGLFGLTIFMINRRTKEIGIRKVLGASANRIMRMLTWQFSKPVIIAFFIASPLAYLAMNVYLQFFAERITLSPLFFGKVGLGVMLFTWLIVGSQSLKVAQSNPSDALRYE